MIKEVLPRRRKDTKISIKAWCSAEFSVIALNLSRKAAKFQTQFCNASSEAYAANNFAPSRLGDS
jgi:hypothetical protein